MMRSMTTVGIRREDKSKWERRAPLAPKHVKILKDQGVDTIIQPSQIRIFTDEEYREAGATVDEDLSSCDFVVAVKEIPTELLEPGKAYMYFSHTIKAQPYNMKMLGRLLDIKATLVDHEKVTDETGKRLVLFGHHAGLAGMIDSLWALGKRLAHEGHDTPFAKVRQAYEYGELKKAEQELSDIGKEIKASQKGLASLGPVVIGLAGYGNVSRGAQHIVDLLDPTTVEPGELGTLEDGKLYKVVFREEHMFAPKEASQPFDLQTYFNKPELFRPTFRPYVDSLTALVNCIYWEERYPRLLTNDDLKEMYADGAKPRLRVIGDISCDVEGSVQATVKATQPDNPVYVYDPAQGRAIDGVAGNGPVIMAVDNLPCELSREATETFGKALVELLPQTAKAGFGPAFADLAVPGPMKRAIIVHKGELTPDFQYLEEHAIRGD